MSNVFELFTPNFRPHTSHIHRDAVSMFQAGMDATHTEADDAIQTAAIKNVAWSRQGQRMMGTHTRRMQKLVEGAHALAGNLKQWQTKGDLDAAWSEYQRDAIERAVLIADALRKRGDIFLEHEAADCPPVLDYEYEMVMDGRTLHYPCNYMLLKILPPPGIKTDNKKRPYIIIDPRAGHGPGIGGFKQDSQVGVALAAGHPVYFVAFRSRPEPGQRLSHVTRAEAAFVREVMRSHPKAHKPAITGNCQGGWAALLLAATNPDLTGPIVVNGAPVVPWAGVVGENPMRYNAGVLGGTWLPMFFSDLGGGIFDGAHLVQNFETLNPGRTLFRKYTDLFRDIDKGDKSFLDFEKWWGGFFMLTEAEICWIVEQLFVGNRLAKNEARLEPGRPIDLKAIRAPIIVFASRGDNITPPQQALNWIPETYADEHEIRIRGQRIVYMLHDQVGHLGIFVSAQIARKEHAQVESSMEMIEALAPGLYEMVIEDVTERNGEKIFSVSFAERTMADIRALDDSFNNERPFAAVARASEIQTQLYDTLVRPTIRATVTPTLAEWSRTLHPKRLERALASSKNPLMAAVAGRADVVRNNRRKAAADNPFLAAEALWVEGVEQMIDFLRDTRDIAYEMAFFNFWATPWMRAFGRSYEAHRTHKSPDELRIMPEVATALHHIGHGGFSDAVIRMLVLLAESRGSVRRDRLERSEWLLSQDEAFKSLGAQQCSLMIREQTLIITYEREHAIETLPALLPSAGERERALRMVHFVVGSEEGMAVETQQLIERFHAVLGQKYSPGEVVTKAALKSNGKAKTTT